MAEDASSSLPVSLSNEYRVIDETKKANAQNGQSESGRLWLRLRRFKPSRSAEDSPAKRVAVDGFETAGCHDSVENDSFCWMCHTDGSLICCDNCPRVYHAKCLGRASKMVGTTTWMCPVCQDMKSAGNWSAVPDLPDFLLLAVNQMYIDGSLPFQHPVDVSAEPRYKECIFHPMDLSTLEKNIRKGVYESPQHFQHETQWILHNCAIYNGMANTWTDIAKAMLRICKREMSEIVLCPDCYRMSMKKTSQWFTKPCAKLHKPVWAKVKGYPFWPAKVLTLTGDKYDVRFFGDHNRAKLVKSFIRNYANTQSAPSHSGYASACREMEMYVENLKKAGYTDTDLQMFPEPSRRHSVEGRFPLKADKTGENKETSRRHSIHVEQQQQQQRHVTESSPSGDESNARRRVMTRQNSRAKTFNHEKFMKNSIITVTPKASVDRLTVNPDDLTKRLRSDAYSSLKPENSLTSNSTGKGQMYVALAGDMSFTFVATDRQLKGSSSSDAELMELTEMPKTSWLEFQGDGDNVTECGSNALQEDGGVADLSVLQAMNCEGEGSVGDVRVDEKADMFGLSELTRSGLVEANGSQLDQSGHPVEGCDDSIEKSCGTPDTEPAGSPEVQICHIIKPKVDASSTSTTTTTTSINQRDTSPSNMITTQSTNTLNVSELAKLESVLKTWTGRLSETVSGDSKTDASERTMRIERAVGKVLAKPMNPSSHPTRTAAALPSSVTTTVSSRLYPLSSPLSCLASTVSRLGQPAMTQPPCPPPAQTGAATKNATVYRVVGTVMPSQSLSSGTVSVRTLSRCPPILPKPLTSNLHSLRLQAPLVVSSRQNTPITSPQQVKIKLCQLAPGTHQQSGIQPNQTQHTVILRPVSVQGQTGGTQSQPMRILNTIPVTQPQTLPTYRGTAVHQAAVPRSTVSSLCAPQSSLMPSGLTSLQFAASSSTQQTEPRTVGITESRSRPPAFVRMNTNQGGQQNVTSGTSVGQQSPRDGGSSFSGGSLFAALHDAMLSDDQSDAVHKESVTAGVDRIMFSVWRQVEEIVMSLQRDTEQHYRKKMNAALAEQRQQLQEEAKRAVKEAKKKHWCANCLEEAGFYCCFNTSYCSVRCQQQHWLSHINYCRNTNEKEGAGESMPQRSNSEPPVGANSELRIVSVSGSAKSTSTTRSNMGRSASTTSTQQQPLRLPHLSTVPSHQSSSERDSSTSGAHNNNEVRLPVIQRVEGADGVVCVDTAECPTRAADEK